MPDRVHVNIHSRASLFASVIRRDATAATTQTGRNTPTSRRKPGVRQGEWFWVAVWHVVAGTQFDNMRRMARAPRGGGRPTIRGLGREARRGRSVALREAVQDGVWDADAVANALLGVEPHLF